MRARYDEIMTKKKADHNVNTGVYMITLNTRKAG